MWKVINPNWNDFFFNICFSVFAKALHALAKVGDNLYIEASETVLSFVSLNLRKTICVKYSFLDNFFSCYEVDGQDVKCKIQMKTLIPLFRGTHLEKKVNCKLKKFLFPIMSYLTFHTTCNVKV